MFARLSAASQQSLLDYAGFLVTRDDATRAPVPLAPPQPIPRPAQETVVAAIRRLSATYTMLDKPVLLHESSALMTQHILQGRAAAAVIDDLEALFLRHFERLRAQRGE